MNARIPRPCPYCILVYYSKVALSTHINKEHWDEQEDAEKEEEDA